jgi:hypothetical protein
LSVTGEKLSISGASRRVGLAVTLLLAGLELFALLSPWEDWPFSSAPMFARSQARGAPVYYLEWWLERPAERRLLSPQRDLGIGELPFRRGYFAAYYGSADPAHPGRRFPNDDEASFLARQSDYCARLEAAWAQKSGTPVPAFELVVAMEEAGRKLSARSIGRCSGKQFRRPP